MKSLFLLLPLIMFCSVGAQEKDSIARKKITISRITEAPKIDGVLNDPAWKDAAIATDFVERTPNNGKPIPDSLKTEVKIVYDNLGIYFGATMNDPSPEKIKKELTERDHIGNDDFFIVLLNGYNDHQQSLEFVVTAAGVQWDAKLANGNEDLSWDGVWYSGAQITEDGWTAEIFIPYSQLRFPDKDVQVWGLQMERAFRRAQTRYSWSHVDNSKGGFSIYDGVLYGIRNIQPPLRLSFQPYVSTYLNRYGGETETVFNGGMDLKYGINEAFTLDMVLVPDFGQSEFDETVLNLSAFETQYEENRAFFTEGTELFTKGDLFYSRRVGGSPSGEVSLAENEILENYPARVDLINAFKISGRTAGGLGLGIFNGITERTFAEIKNTETGTVREKLVAPLANYNVLVLDQRFGDNSSVSFVNTNTLREGQFRDANATGLYAHLTNKKNTWEYFAHAEGSWVLEDETTFGMEGGGGFSEIKGAHRFTGEVFFRTKDYDINDLGFSSETNFIQYYTNYSYRYLQPKGFLNDLFLIFNLSYLRRLEPDLYHDFEFDVESQFTTKEFFAFGGGLEIRPFGSNDIYEPRVEGRYVKIPAYYEARAWISTDYRKKFAFDFGGEGAMYDEEGRSVWFLEFEPRYRFSDQWSVFLGLFGKQFYGDKGFVNLKNNEIIFGRRDRNIFVSGLESQYIFNNKMALNLTFRHYWSEVDYDQFYTLKTDGNLVPNPLYNQNHDTTFNTWNIDLRFSWWFAPGSELTLLYRNAIQSKAGTAQLNFSENFDVLFNQPQLNSLSLRVTYYLDYNQIKNWFGPKKDGGEGLGQKGWGKRNKMRNRIGAL